MTKTEICQNSGPVKNCVKKHGFTLTEILVVVLIVAVLAAVVYPLYTKAVLKSRAVEAINLLEMAKTKQINHYARNNSYFDDFSNIDQLTSAGTKEKAIGRQLYVEDYTVSLKGEKNCLSVNYRKGSADFTFSASYENAGLGCTGSICSSFGNIIGRAEEICNCGDKKCSDGFTLNNDTCACECLLSCENDGRCFDPYGGGDTRNCSSGCGTEVAISTCNGRVWSGKCWSQTQEQQTSRRCGWKDTGNQIRKCVANCSGGSCQAWGTCVGQSCDIKTKPVPATQACGNCGTQSKVPICDSNSGTWLAGTFGECKTEGVCKAGATQVCGKEGTQTCSEACGWGPCTGEKIDCDLNKKPPEAIACGNCNSGTQKMVVTCDRVLGEWKTYISGGCEGEKGCKPNERTVCGTGFKVCSNTCTWGDCSCDPSKKPTGYPAIAQNIGGYGGGFSVNVGIVGGPGGGTTINPPPISSGGNKRACGKCGTQAYEYTCNKETGIWSAAWGACNGEKVNGCEPGSKQKCTDLGESGGSIMICADCSQTCSSNCTWGTCNPNQQCKPGEKIKTTTGPDGKCQMDLFCAEDGIGVVWGGWILAGGPSTKDCGKCGKQTSYCDGGGNFSEGTCTGEGSCSPGDKDDCGWSWTGTRTCSTSCTWGSCSGEQKPPDGNGACTKYCCPPNGEGGYGNGWKCPKYFYEGREHIGPIAYCCEFAGSNPNTGGGGSSIGGGGGGGPIGGGGLPTVS